MVAIDSGSFGSPYAIDIPMHPRPSADTAGPCFPSLRVFIASSCAGAGLYKIARRAATIPQCWRMIFAPDGRTSSNRKEYDDEQEVERPAQRRAGRAGCRRQRALLHRDVEAHESGGGGGGRGPWGGP